MSAREANLEQQEAGRYVLQAQAVLAGTPVTVRLGVQSWGMLNEKRDNAVLVCHYYTGTSAAAGLQPDGTPGWWDSLIGPGRAIDTERFFVICMNTLSNVQAGHPQVVTTGPDTLHPDGQPWGERFPRWTFADLHALQCQLMQALGVARWHAVLGPSLGGMQALQWAARSPELAPRVAAVAASPAAGPALRGAFGPLLRAVAHSDGTLGALRLISFFGLGADGLEAQFRDQDFGAFLKSRSGTASLAHILDIARLVQTHDMAAAASWPQLFERWRQCGLELLTVNITVDQFFPVAEMRAFAEASRRAGVRHQHLEFASAAGHLGCVQDTGQFADQVRTLLERASPVSGR